MMRTACVFATAACLLAASAQAEAQSGLTQGTPDIQMAGPLTFGPDGILFIGDPQSAAVFAIATGDTQGDPSQVRLNIDGLDAKVAALLGASARDVLINDLAVNPASGQVYLSVSRGRGPQATPVVMRINPQGEISEVSLKNVPFAKAELPNAPAPGGTGRQNRRAQSITDLKFVDGRLFVAGLSNEEFASKLRSIPFPFESVDAGTSVEIYHGAHGAFETRSPVRTFVPYNIEGQPHLLAAYTCTPLVKFPIAELQAGNKVKGTTVAELGNRNNPLDMVVYKKDGKDYILIANTSRGVMKVQTDEIAEIEGIETRISGTAGVKYQTIEELKGVVQLDKLNDTHAVLLVQSESGQSNLQTIALP